jgi:hypothetical protein
MKISWWSKHVGVILSVLTCDIWINVLLQTSALVGPLHIVLQLVQKFPAFYKTLRLIAVFTKAYFQVHVIPNPTGRISELKFDMCVFFENLSKNFQVSLKPDKNNGYITWIPKYIYDNTSLNSP